MPMGRIPASGPILLLALLCAGSHVAFAQAPRSWVDPPAESGAPSQAPAQQPEPVPATPPAQSAQPVTPSPAPPTPEPRQAAQPPRAAPPAAVAQPRRDSEETRHAARVGTVKDFVAHYLESWSAPNDLALEATAELYAPRVLFHGRTMSIERLFREKKRFAQRWPERDYQARQNATGAECNPDGTVCKVHTVFDFKAANPARRRASEGAGVLQLVVNFIGDKPIIIAEHSALFKQERKHAHALEGASNE